MQSGEAAPTTAASVNGETSASASAVAPEPGTESDAAVVVMAPEPAGMKEMESVEEAPQAAPVIEAAAVVATQKETKVPTVAGGDGSRSPKSPAPTSPSMVKERQISVDPASLRRLGMVADEDPPLSAPSVFTEVVVQSPLLPPLRRPTFVGASLPCSAASSPVHGAGSSAKWEENPTIPSPRSALRSLARQHSAALARLVVAAPPPAALSRSASRAEGRTMAPHDDEEGEDHDGDTKALAAAEDGAFTCGALCMLIPIPGFSKPKKPAAAAGSGMAVSGMKRQQSGGKPRRSAASRVASLERFECGSWSPPPPPATAARDSSECHAMELPEISCAGDETESPVKMAFVFDGGDAAPTPRGILKNSASASRLSSARPSTSLQRHVRFSTAAAADVVVAVSCPSSPTSVVTPRLALARAEFNAFLEAQSV